MAINISYDVPFTTQGPIAYHAGRGQFLQDRDRYDFSVRQFDEQQGLREAQFDESIRQYDQNFDEGVRRYDQDFDESERRYDTTFGEGQRQFNVGTRLNYDKLRQNQYQFDRQLNQRSFELGEQRELRQQEIEANLADRQQYRQMLERKDFRQLQQQKQRQRFGEWLNEWQKIQDFQGFRNPEQKAQAEQQAIERFRDVNGGEAPFSEPWRNELGNIEGDKALQSFQKTFDDPDLTVDDMRQWGSFEEDGSWIPSPEYLKMASKRIADKDALKGQAEAAQQKIDLERVKQESAARQKELDRTQQQDKEARDRRIKEKAERITQNREADKAEAERLQKIYDSIVDEYAKSLTTKDRLGVEVTKPPNAEEFKKFAQQRMEQWQILQSMLGGQTQQTPVATEESPGGSKSNPLAISADMNAAEWNKIPVGTWLKLPNGKVGQKEKD